MILGVTLGLTSGVMLGVMLGLTSGVILRLGVDGSGSALGDAGTSYIQLSPSIIYGMAARNDSTVP